MATPTSFKRRTTVGEHAGWREARLAIEQQFADDLFGPPMPLVGPPKPRMRFGSITGHGYLMATGDRMRAAIREDILQEFKAKATVKARQLSLLRWRAEHADRARTLELARTMKVRHRIEAARKIAELFEHEGRFYELSTIDSWLKQPDWRLPVISQTPVSGA